MTSEETTNDELRVRLTRLEEEQKKALEALRASEERYRLLVERSPDAMAIHTGGRFVYANQAALELYGASTESNLIGHTVLEFVHPDERETVARRISEMDGEAARRFRRESKIQRLNGQTVHVEISGARTVYQGQAAAVVFLRDISDRKRTELEMERLASFPQLNPNPIVEADLDGQIHFMNPAAQRYLPELPQAGLNHPWLSDWDTVAQTFRRARTNQIIRDVVSGDRCYQQTIYYSPEKKHIRVYGTDITERKRMEEALRQSEERFRTLAAATFEGIVITENGRCTDVNDQMARIFRYEPSEMIGMEVFRFVAPEDRPRVLDNIAGGRETLTEHGAIRKDGTRIVVETLGKTVTYQGRRVRITAVRDITARNQAEEALRKAKAELEDRVRERTAELSQAVQKMQVEIDRRAQAEEGLHERSEQLRVLAAMLTMTEQRERKRMAQILHDHLQQLLVGAKFRIAGLERDEHPHVRQVALEVRNLIDQTIETSRSLTGELSPPILREGGLIPALEWLVRWMKEKHDLTIDLEAGECGTPITEDVTILLFQAARELLLNVVKHAKTKRALVKVSLHSGQIEITVTDHGIGFDPGQLWPEGEIAGGFGLFSIRERFSLQGGQLVVDSAPGRGCCAKISVPIPQAAASDAAPAPGTVATAPNSGERPAAGADLSHGVPNKILVLIADDHKVMREGMRKLLQEQADIMVVGEAEDGNTAAHLARKIRPDVILMDVSMPGLNGIQATRIIHDELPQIRIVGLSMFSESEQAAAMLDAGAVDYLSKTCPSDSIIRAIRACACPLGIILAAASAKQPDRVTLPDILKWRPPSPTAPRFNA